MVKTSLMTFAFGKTDLEVRIFVVQIAGLLPIFLGSSFLKELKLRVFSRLTLVRMKGAKMYEDIIQLAREYCKANGRRWRGWTGK